MFEFPAVQNLVLTEVYKTFEVRFSTIPTSHEKDTKNACFRVLRSLLLLYEWGRNSVISQNAFFTILFVLRGEHLRNF